jgi:hypothetical protein
MLAPCTLKGEPQRLRWLLEVQRPGLEVGMERRLLGFSLNMWGSVARLMGANLGEQQLVVEYHLLLHPVRELLTFLIKQQHQQRNLAQFGLRVENKFKGHWAVLWGLLLAMSLMMLIM